LFCGNCGKKINKANKYCPECGSLSKAESTKEIDEKNIIVTKNYKKLLLIGLITIISLLAVLEIVVILFDSQWISSVKVISSIFVVCWFGYSCMVSIDLYEKTNHKIFGIFTQISSALGFIIGPLLALELFDIEPIFLMKSLGIISIMTIHFGKLLQIKLVNEYSKKALFITKVIGLIAYTMIVMQIWFGFIFDWYFKAMFVGIILMILGTILTLIANKIK